MMTSFTGYWLTRWRAALPRALAEQRLNRRGEHALQAITRG